MSFRNFGQPLAGEFSVSRCVFRARAPPPSIIDLGPIALATARIDDGGFPLSFFYFFPRPINHYTAINIRWRGDARTRTRLQPRDNFSRLRPRLFSSSWRTPTPAGRGRCRASETSQIVERIPVHGARHAHGPLISFPTGYRRSGTEREVRRVGKVYRYFRTGGRHSSRDIARVYGYSRLRMKLCFNTSSHTGCLPILNVKTSGACRGMIN